MRSMRPVSTMVLVGMWLGGFSACSTVLMNTPVSKSADGWVVTLGQVTKGPDEYVGERVVMNPGTGDALIWTVVTVRNESTQEDTFSYDTCVLETKGEARRMITQGGAYVNNRRVAAVETQLTAANLASQSTMILRSGKKNYALLRFV